MSEAFVNQVTLDCLLNKKMFNNHIRNQKSKQLNKEDKLFYENRIINLFKEMLTEKCETDLSPEVKYAYDNFLNAAINYFKTIDNNELIQSEYNSIDNSISNLLNDTTFLEDPSLNTTNNIDADTFLMRKIKTDIHTLDKYVTKTTIKKANDVILPKQKEINLKDPKFKNKGLKKKNIDNLYEDTETNTQNISNETIKTNDKI
jgi:hypothetical protein